MQTDYNDVSFSALHCCFVQKWCLVLSFILMFTPIFGFQLYIDSLLLYSSVFFLCFILKFYFPLLCHIYEELTQQKDHRTCCLLDMGALLQSSGRAAHWALKTWILRKEQVTFQILIFKKVISRKCWIQSNKKKNCKPMLCNKSNRYLCILPEDSEGLQ